MLVSSNTKFSAIAKDILNRNYTAAVIKLKSMIRDINQKKNSLLLDPQILADNIKKMARAEIKSYIDDLGENIIEYKDSEDDPRTTTLPDYVNTFYSISKDKDLKQILELMATIAFPRILGVKDSSQKFLENYLPIQPTQNLAPPPPVNNTVTVLTTSRNNLESVTADVAPGPMLSRDKQQLESPTTVTASDITIITSMQKEPKIAKHATNPSGHFGKSSTQKLPKDEQEPLLKKSDTDTNNNKLCKSFCNII